MSDSRQLVIEVLRKEMKILDDELDGLSGRVREIVAESIQNYRDAIEWAERVYDR